MTTRATSTTAVDVDPDRFAFGRNWRSFLSVVDEQRIESAATGLRKLLQLQELEGMSFLDVGCGSGLSSLAARRLGAIVRSFDFDPDAVACCEELKRRYCPGDEAWTIERGSALDPDYLATLGTFDVVYSWGVLHHTGDMWRALDLVRRNVAPGGRLSIAIYNDQGGASRRWKAVKRTYVRAPRPLQLVMVLGVGTFFEVRRAGIHMLRLQNPLPFQEWRQRRNIRGMSVYHDLVDWVGGYPFEVAKPDEVFSFLKERGFTLEGMSTCGTGHGCNEFLFRINHADSEAGGAPNG